MYLCICLSIYSPTRPSIHPSIRPSIDLLICPSIHALTHLSIHPSIHQSIYLLICLSICLVVYLWFVSFFALSFFSLRPLSARTCFIFGLLQVTYFISQEVWKNSRQFGIGTARGEKYGFIAVARYSPRGNKGGPINFKDNVFAPGIPSIKVGNIYIYSKGYHRVSE